MHFQKTESTLKRHYIISLIIENYIVITLRCSCITCADNHVRGPSYEQWGREIGSDVEKWSRSVCAQSIDSNGYRARIRRASEC